MKTNVSKNPTISKAKQAYLLRCVQRGAIDKVKNILKAGNIDVNDKDNSDGVTALHEAVRAGNIPIIKELLKYEANIEARDPDDLTPLHFAVQNSLSYPHPNRSSHIDVVSLLLENGANVHAVSNEEGYSVLHLCDVPEVFEYFLNLGLDINARNKTGQTPLYESVGIFGSLDMLRILLRNGAQVNIQDANKESPLIQAIKYGPNDLKKDLVSELLKHGANPITGWVKNITPLHIAAFNGLKDIITELLKFGAEVNSRNTHYETPLHLAVSVNEDTRKLIGSVEDHVTIVTELIKNGADINAFDEKGQSPIHFAMEVPELAMVL